MSAFELGSVVTVNNRMQSGYSYKLVCAPGQDFDLRFRPVFTPNQMLRLGVFNGKYMSDCLGEYPPDMFAGARLCIVKPDPSGCNAFKVRSGDSLAFWREQGWIHEDDPRGWFEWYCRYWLGRRHPDDERQIARWRFFAGRHQGALMHFGEGDISKRAKTRQSLLHWAHDPCPDCHRDDVETRADKVFRILQIKKT